MVPLHIPGGKPVMPVPGHTPHSPVMAVAPVLVTERFDEAHEDGESAFLDSGRLLDRRCSKRKDVELSREESEDGKLAGAEDAKLHDERIVQR